MELLIVIWLLAALSLVTAFAMRAVSDRSQGTACQSERRNLEQAVQSYYAVARNDAAPTEQQLVDAGLLVAPSRDFDIDRAGDVVPSAGNGGHCA